MRTGREAALEPMSASERKAIHMIHPQPVHRTGMHQFEDQPVGIIKYGVVFHAHASQPGDLKEAAIGEIARRIADVPHDVIFLSGVGEVYPYLRSHNVLNNLQSTAKDRPTVMFFPGKYTHALATGASLELFGLLHDDKYYRAFNIMNYEV